ncbi:OmpH family outer membrane protein [uncultured Fibrella sp.]|uniref:OmpH family outer membrane protein n=1 Tax=uncultured Fibrella sp. TaxID=1284596 RepID=UPI0035CC19B7
MKRGLFLVTLLLLVGSAPAWAQKFGYVDTEFIFSKLPEYKKAQEGIDQFADRWSKDILDKQLEIEKMQRAYQAEEILLTDDMKRERQRVIGDKEREAREYNNKVFGYEGLLFQKKKELMKTPMELLNRALEKVASQRKLNFIFDKASEGMLMLYTDPKHDYTDYVMEELGLDPDSQKAKQTPIAQPANSAKPK